MLPSHGGGCVFVQGQLPVIGKWELNLASSFHTMIQDWQRYLVREKVEELCFATDDIFLDGIHTIFVGESYIRF